MVESDVTRSRSRDRKIERFVTRVVTYEVNVTKDVITSISRYDCRSDLCVFFVENRAVYEIMAKNIIHSVRSQMTIQHMCLACWITKAANTHSEYKIRIAFPLQQ